MKTKVSSNSKQVRERVRSHILDCVYDFNGDYFNSFEDCAKHLVSEFKRVSDYNDNIKLIPNHQDRFQDYLMKLPFRFEYTCHGFEEFINSLGFNPDGKVYDCDQMLRKYTFLIWREISDYYYNIK